MDTSSPEARRLPAAAVLGVTAVLSAASALAAVDPEGGAGEGLAFVLFAAVSVGGGGLALFARDPGRAAAPLFVSTLGTAGLFVLLGDDFTALAAMALFAAVGLGLWGLAPLVGGSRGQTGQSPAVERPGPRRWILTVLAGALLGALVWRWGPAFVPDSGPEVPGFAGVPSPHSEPASFTVLVLLAVVAIVFAAAVLTRGRGGRP